MDDFIYNTLREKILNTLKENRDRCLPEKESFQVFSMKPAKEFFAFDLGRIGYEKAFNLQVEIFELIKDTDFGGVILLLEHDPVITIGSNSNMSNIVAAKESLSSQGIELLQSNRGGDVTFHGPGQLVCYPIFNLKYFGQDLTLFVYNLEEVILSVIAEYSISGFRINKLRGVFTEKGKIASIGLRVKKWITLHGFSLNANVNLEYFKNIIACGLKDYRQTSIKEILKKDVALPQLKDYIIKYFMMVFDIKVYKCPLK
ncbi:MAG: lipoyl(octanoyl) transferase LipB [Actinobacteria bacterium]|nr:lipoyl(octanoyl) transferase LipB [Actinomycetota bacterium]